MKSRYRHNISSFRKGLVAFALLVLAAFGTIPIASAQDGSRNMARNMTVSDYYGAIAYSSSTRRFGSSWNQPNQSDAEQAARSSCGRSDCRVLLWFANSCGALAIARNGAHAWNGGGSLYEAKLLTSNRCTRDFGGCKLVCSVCSRGNVP